MSDDAEKSTETDGSEPLAGEVLARARLARHISLQDISRDLHLDEPKVRALEQNAFELLGAPVFTKGYLRKYAELVGVPVDDVIADYYRLNRSSGLPPLVTKRERPMHDFSPVPWLGGLAVLLAVVLAGAWWFSSGEDTVDVREMTETPAPTETDEVRLPEAAEPVTDDEADPVPAVEQTDDELSSSSAAQPALQRPEPSRTPDVSAAAATGTGLQLRLAFSGDCWTEVTDASGRRLYFGLGAAGNEVSVAGEPPLNVLLGDSENVSVFVNGSSYAIPASARRGDTARLTLTAR